MEIEDECIHLLRPGECSLCKPKPPPRPKHERRHQWTETDDVACVGAWYRYDGRVPSHVAADLADLIGTTEASIVLRVANVDAILGGGTMSNVANLTRTVARRFASMEPAARREAFEDAVGRLRDRPQC